MTHYGLKNCLGLGLEFRKLGNNLYRKLLMLIG